MGCFSKPSVKQQSTLTPAQSQYVNRGLNQAWEGIQGGVDPYMGQRVAGASPLQQQQFGALGAYGSDGIAAMGRIANSQAPLEAMAQYGQRYATDVIAPQVMENFAGIGAGDSGGAMKGLARELGNYGLGMQNQIGQMSMQNQGQQLQAGGMLANQMQYGGAAQYDLANQVLAGQQQQWAESQAYNNPWYNVGAQFMGNYTTPVQQGGGMGYSMLSSAAGSLGQSLGKLPFG